MQQVHVYAGNRTSLDDIPYEACIQLDYVGFIAGQALIRAQKLIAVNLSLLQHRVPLLEHFHA
jgi:hypothetical protein